MSTEAVFVAPSSKAMPKWKNPCQEWLRPKAILSTCFVLVLAALAMVCHQMQQLSNNYAQTAAASRNSKVFSGQAHQSNVMSNGYGSSDSESHWTANATTLNLNDRAERTSRGFGVRRRHGDGDETSLTIVTGTIARQRPNERAGDDLNSKSPSSATNTAVAGDDGTGAAVADSDATAATATLDTDRPVKDLATNALPKRGDEAKVSKAASFDQRLETGKADDATETVTTETDCTRIIESSATDAMPLPEAHLRPHIAAEPKPWAALCAVMKNEERYVNDWTDYHLAIGFEHIFIYDNDPGLMLSAWYDQRVQDERQEMAEAAADEKDITLTERRVHLQPTDVPPGAGYKQNLVYNHCLDQLRNLPHPPKWVMVLDADEYLVLRDVNKYPNAVAFFADHVREGSVQLSWVVMGSSYEMHYKNEPVVKRFQMALEPSLFLETKTVAVLDHVLGWEVHFAVHKDGYSGIGMGGREPGSGNVNRTVNHWPGYIENGDTSVAAVYHYKFKSYDEFNAKDCVRGDFNGVENVCPAPGESGTIFDDRAWQAMQHFVPKYRSNPAQQQQPKSQPQQTGAAWTALCAIVTEGDERYVREWTDYHVALGFESIYLFDSHPNFTVYSSMLSWYNFDEWSPIKASYEEDGAGHGVSSVQVLPRVLPTRLGVAGDEIIYSECLQDLRSLAHPPQYVMALDINDFLVLKDLYAHPNVTAFLTKHLSLGSLRLSRVVMGSANESAYDEAPVTQRFPLAIEPGRLSEVRPAALLEHIEGLKVHDAIHKQGFGATTIGGKPAHVDQAPCCIEDGDVSVAAIYHYKFKSVEEYRDQQCHRRWDPHRASWASTGEEDSGDPSSCMVHVEAGTIWDDTAWRTLARLVPRYSSADSEVG